jgi:hypothetical protein
MTRAFVLTAAAVLGAATPRGGMVVAAESANEMGRYRLASSSRYQNER